MSQAARRKIEERERQRQAEDARPEMSGAQAAEAKRSMAALMLPKETVSRAMNRLRPPGDCLALLEPAVLAVQGILPGYLAAQPFPYLRKLKKGLRKDADPGCDLDGASLHAASALLHAMGGGPSEFGVLC